MYPYTYDNITTIDLAQCSIYSHTLTDGFLGDFYEFVLGNLEQIFVKYGTSVNPKIDIIKNNEALILKEITGSRFNDSIYSFNIFFDELGEISPEGVIWQDGVYILKIYSDDSDLVYYKPIKLIRENDARSTQQDIKDIIDAIGSESNEIQSDIDYIPYQHTGAKIKM